MSNTENYFSAIKEYRNVVKAANEEYNKEIAAAEDFKGSVMYDKSVNTAKDKLEKALSAARSEARPKINEAIKNMKANVNELKPVPATSEMLEQLQLLKLRDNVSDNELRAVGELCSSCPSAFAVVQEMAQKRGLPLVPKRGTLGGDGADRAVEALRAAADISLQMPKVNNRAQWLDMNKSYQTGIEDTTNGRAMDFFKYDRDFDSARDMIGSWSGISDGFNAFYETLDTVSTD